MIRCSDLFEFYLAPSTKMLDFLFSIFCLCSKATVFIHSLSDFLRFSLLYRVTVCMIRKVVCFRFYFILLLCKLLIMLPSRCCPSDSCQNLFGLLLNLTFLSPLRFLGQESMLLFQCFSIKISFMGIFFGALKVEVRHMFQLR